MTTTTPTRPRRTRRAPGCLPRQFSVGFHSAPTLTLIPATVVVAVAALVAT